MRRDEYKTITEKPCFGGQKGLKYDDVDVQHKELQKHIEPDYNSETLAEFPIHLGDSIEDIVHVPAETMAALMGCVL